MEKAEAEVQQPENVRIIFGKERSPEPSAKKTGEPTVEEIKAAIAEIVRADSRERGVVTPSETVFTLIPDTREDRVTAILDEMGTDARYADIKAVTTASGMAFFCSTDYIDPAAAVAKSRVEELKRMVAEKIRADSRDNVALTPVADVAAYLTEEEQGRFEELMSAIRTDDWCTDIRKVTAPNGEVFFHSDRHMSGYYAVVLSRIAAKDHCATIAAMVRDESRIYPRPTCVQLFMEKPFDIPSCDLRGVVEAMLRRPEYEDIKMIVHPGTGGVYLYSDQYLKESTAKALMDWQEVGKDANP